MYCIEKQLKEFCAAHRLIHGYQGKCQHLHGHSYVVNVRLSSEALNQFGFVIDFVDIKAICEQWISEQVDHATLVSSADTELLSFVQQHNQRHYVLPDGKNTTTECLAENFYQHFSKLLQRYNQTNQTQIELTSVSVAETPTSAATYTI